MAWEQNSRHVMLPDPEVDGLIKSFCETDATWSRYTSRGEADGQFTKDQI